MPRGQRGARGYPLCGQRPQVQLGWVGRNCPAVLGTFGYQVGSVMEMAFLRPPGGACSVAQPTESPTSPKLWI